MRTVGSGILIVVLAASAPGWSQEASVTPSSMDRSMAPGNIEESTGVKRLDDTQGEEKKRLLRFEMALAGLDSAPDTRELKRHLDFLGRHFADARPVLVTAVRQGTPRVRALVIKLFGDHGNVADDLDTVAWSLDDYSPTVRMAAVAALRRLGKEGSSALLRRLPREREPEIRKMAVRTLKMWKDPDALPPLARLLSSEKHAGVRKHTVRALEWLSGKRYGDDTEAWLAFAEEYRYRKNAKRLLEYSRSFLPNHPTKTGKTE